jgi:hypothetical protein
MATGLDGYPAAGGTSNSFFDGTSDGFSSPGESRQPEIIELPTPTRRRRVVSCPLSQRVYRGNPKNGYRGGSADSKGRQLDAERQCKCRNAKIWQGQAGILATVFRHKKTSANSHTRGLATNTNRCGTCSSAQGRIAKLMGRSSRPQGSPRGHREMAHPLHHPATPFGAWLQTSGTTHPRSVTTNPRGGHREISSPGTISVRPKVLANAKADIKLASP